VTRRGRLDVRVVSVLFALTAAALAALVAGVALGEFPIPPLEVVETLVGAGDRATNFIVLDLRLPRALTGLLVGAALGIAGAVFQEVTRNPLAAPDIVGVSGGASLAAVTLVVFGSGSALSVPFVALAGALIAGAGLYAFAWRRGIHGARLVLIGIGVAAFAHAGITYVLAKGRIFEVAQAYVWLVGSLNGRGWSHVWPLAATLAVLAPLLYLLGRRADVLALGDDVARALGLGVERTRLLMLALAVGLTGIAVAAAGPIAFVAFVAPHISRRLGRAQTAQSLLALSAATGAALVLVADLAGRLTFSPHEVPVGIVTSVLAAPYFLFLLRRAAA
jgi:iron complex transport system permease protein